MSKIRFTYRDDRLVEIKIKKLIATQIHKARQREREMNSFGALISLTSHFFSQHIFLPCSTLLSRVIKQNAFENVVSCLVSLNVCILLALSELSLSFHNALSNFLHVYSFSLPSLTSHVSHSSRRKQASMESERPLTSTSSHDSHLTHYHEEQGNEEALFPSGGGDSATPSPQPFLHPGAVDTTPAFGDGTSPSSFKRNVLETGISAAPLSPGSLGSESESSAPHQHSRHREHVQRFHERKRVMQQGEEAEGLQKKVVRPRGDRQQPRAPPMVLATPPRSLPPLLPPDPLSNRYATTSPLLNNALSHQSQHNQSSSALGSGSVAVTSPDILSTPEISPIVILEGRAFGRCGFERMKGRKRKREKEKGERGVGGVGVGWGSKRSGTERSAREAEKNSEREIWT